MLGRTFLLSISMISALAFAACGGNVQTPNGQGGGGGADGAGGQGGGKTCGGFGAVQCADDEFCDYPGDTCGIGDGTGVCKKRPTVCSDGIPVCFCDGTVSDMPCPGIKGSDIDVKNNCKHDPGLFPCGAKLCAVGEQYCKHSISDVGGEPDSWECQPVPAGCPAQADCTCLANVACGDKCAVANGGATLTCPGG